MKIVLKTMRSFKMNLGASSWLNWLEHRFRTCLAERPESEPHFEMHKLHLKMYQHAPYCVC